VARLKLIIALFIVVFITGCDSSRIITVHDKYHYPLAHSKIMTVCVVNDVNDSIRHRVESIIGTDLRNSGYATISALEKFGAKGLSGLGEEETYLKLCAEDIDAILVVTLIDQTKESRLKAKKSYGYPDNYYYDRIWNYSRIRADLTDNKPDNNGSYFWEAILFNLSTLEAECTIQSRPFASPYEAKARDFEKQVINKLMKQKILEKQKNAPKKAF
jgi:hypothetical protein